MTTPDRTPAGLLLVGKGPGGRAYHPVVAGAAACSPAIPIPTPVPIDQVGGVRWCQRPACRRHWRTERRALVATSDAEHVCPACYVERPTGPGPCPSCGSPYAAVPEAALGSPR